MPQEPRTYISALEFLPRSLGTHGGCLELRSLLIELMLFGLNFVAWTATKPPHFFERILHVRRSQSIHWVLNDILVLGISGSSLQLVRLSKLGDSSENLGRPVNLGRIGLATDSIPRWVALLISPRTPLYRHYSHTPRVHVLWILFPAWTWMVSPHSSTLLHLLLWPRSSRSSRSPQIYWSGPSQPSVDKEEQHRSSPQPRPSGQLILQYFGVPGSSWVLMWGEEMMFQGFCFFWTLHLTEESDTEMEDKP